MAEPTLSSIGVSTPATSAVRLARAILAGGALYGVLALGIMLYTSFTNPIGNYDFHVFWYGGHFLWEGRDPYIAFTTGAEPTTPLQYVDGVTVYGDPARPSLHTIPTNTAPMYFLLMPLSRLSWVSAKFVWLGINTLLMLAAPLLTLSLATRSGILLHKWQRIAVVVAFLAIAAPRYAVGYGQPSLLVYDFMMVALILRHSHRTAAGIALGIAMSKYSLVFPVFLLLAFWREWRVIGVAVVLQVTALLAINVLAGSTPLETIRVYAEVAATHLTKSGIHIGSLVNGSPVFRFAAPLALTIVLTLVLYRERRQLTRIAPSRVGEFSSTSEFSMIAIALLWGVLVVYHRLYDGFLILPFLVLLFWAIDREISYSTRLGWYGMAIITLMSLPMPLYELGFGDYWIKIANSVWTLVLCSALVVAVAVVRSGRGNAPGPWLTPA